MSKSVTNTISEYVRGSFCGYIKNVIDFDHIKTI